MARILVLVSALLWSATATANGMGNLLTDQAILYTIEGYLDQAPDGVTVQEHILLGAAGYNRHFMLTAYQRAGQGNPWVLVRTLHAFQPDFLLMGPSQAITRILDAAAGSHVRGSFLYLQSQHCLVINPFDLTVE